MSRLEQKSEPQGEERLFDARLEAAREYWLARLAEPFEAPCPTLDKTSDEGPAMVRMHFGGKLEEAMVRLSKGSPFLLFVQLATALQVVLARLSGGAVAAFGSPLYRGEQGGEVAAGAVVILQRLQPEQTFRQLLGEVRKALLEAYAHQDYPWRRLEQDLRSQVGSAQGELFHVVLGSSHLHGPFPPLGQGVHLRWTGGEGMEVELTSTGLRGSAGLRFLERLRVVLQAGLADPAGSISSLPTVSRAARQQLLIEWNDTALALPPGDRLVHRLFEAQVALDGDRLAAQHGEECWSYRQLDERAQRLATFLTSLGMGPESLIGLAVERSIDMLLAVLAVLKAGAAYVPLDPTYPPERLAFMVQDAGLAVVLSQRRLADRLAECVAELAVEVIYLDEQRPWSLAPSGQVVEPVVEPVVALAGGVQDHSQELANRLAYVIYTSGSTGQPKGIAMHHGALYNLIWWQKREAALGHGKRRLQFASLSFDGSFREIFSTWAVGGTLLLIDEDLRQDVPALVRYMAEHEVEKILLPAVMLGRLAEEGKRRPQELRHLREVITAGEQVRVSPGLVDLFQALPAARLHNHYGPSETHVTTAGPLPPNPACWEVLPSIGRPINNHRLYCLDRRGEPVALDAVGELHIGGAGVARGYHRRPRRTAESFVPDPFAPQPGARLYRSGDLVRRDASGALHFLGRRDHQVKIRGFRVEPGEIEAVVGSHPAVREAVVVARPGAGEELRLVAYFVPREGAAETLAEELRGFLGQRLPAHMVPAFLVPLAALPVTSNRKIDRAALPDPTVEHADGRAPRSPDEELLAAIWCEVLGLAEVGVEEDFFALGGHSLLATQVVSRLRSTLGVEVPVRQVFSHPTIEGLAGAVATARRQEMAVPPLTRRPRDSSLRLSPAQERLWFVQQLDPSMVSYNLPNALQLRGTLDLVALQAAFHLLRQRHEVLRTHYPEEMGGPRQRILAARLENLPLIDLEALPAVRRPGEMRRLAAAEAARSFHLAMAPPFRHSVVRLAGDDHVLLLTVHHIASDGWSVGILIRELMAFYAAWRAGSPAALPPLPLQYADFAAWQREFLSGEVLARQVTWWQERLAGLSELHLVTDRPRRAGRAAVGRLGARLPASLMEGVKALGRRRTATLFMTLLAAFHALLHRVSGQRDVAVGSAIANRDRAEVEGLIGFFVNLLVMRAHIDRSTTVASLLESSREMALGAYAHQNVPFEKLVEVLAPERDRHRHPLFQVLLTLQNVPLAELVVPECEVRSLGFGNPAAKYDLLLAIEDHQGVGILGMEYNADLFDATTVRRLLGHFRRVLEGMVADDGRTVAELALLAAAEQHQLLHEWNDAFRPYPRQATAHGLFEECARRSPQAQALAFGEGGTMSYGELAQQVEALARVLIEEGVEREMPVAFCLGRTPQMVVATLAILKAGGLYVPLDPSWPQEHMSLLLADAGAPLLLALEVFREVLPQPTAEQRVIWLDQQPAPIPGAPPPPQWPTVDADQLAYLMYTSGSTGRPKGVAVRHRSLVRLVRGSEFAPLGAGDRVAQSSTPAFDAATFEIWGALLNGGCLVLLPREAILTPQDLRRALRQQAVTAMFLTTPLFNQLARQDPEVVASLEQLVVGGDAIDPEASRAVLAASPTLRLINGYGPTEGTTFSTWYRLPPGLPASGRMPIGRPLANATAQVLDRRLVPVPIAIPGQLFLGGEGLARGYHRRPARTALSFVPDPAAGSSPARPPGSRLYASGDLVRALADGALDFLGRIDQQIKIRGFRVEPGEVESKLLAVPGVRAAAVVVRGPVGDRQLVAYVVGDVDPVGLRETLRQRLPEYMLPAAVVPLASLPLNANGKVDRKVLPDPQPHRSPDFEAPATAAEERLAVIWSEVLEQEKVGRRDDFFALGGHSLKMTQVVSRVREGLGIELSLGDFFSRPVLAEQAAWIEAEQERQELAAVSGRDLGDLLAAMDDLSDEEAERLLAAEEAEATAAGDDADAVADDRGAFDFLAEDPPRGDPDGVA